MMTSHYAPRARLRLDIHEVRPGEALLAFGPTVPTSANRICNLSPGGDLAEAAANLFAMLRQLDQSGVDDDRGDARARSRARRGDQRPPAPRGRTARGGPMSALDPAIARASRRPPDRMAGAKAQARSRPISSELRGRWKGETPSAAEACEHGRGFAHSRDLQRDAERPSCHRAATRGLWADRSRHAARCCFRSSA